MTHLKAIRVDDRYLILGSSNFDFVSYRCQQELIVIIRDPGLIRLFQRKVERPDLSRGIPWEKNSVGITENTSGRDSLYDWNFIGFLEFVGWV